MDVTLDVAKPFHAAVGGGVALTVGRIREIRSGQGNPATEAELSELAELEGRARIAWQSPTLAAELQRSAAAHDEFKAHVGIDPSEVEDEFGPGYGNLKIRQVLAQTRRGSRGRAALDAALVAKVREVKLAMPVEVTTTATTSRGVRSRARERRAGGAARGQSRDEPSDPEPPLGRRFEVDLLLGRSRPMNGHHEWADSTVMREVSFFSLPVVKGDPGKVAGTRVAAALKQSTGHTCPRCSRPVAKEERCPGRTWCRSCENVRCRKAYRARKARAAA